MSEASIYQQLRGHLAELRLTAAAEALPAELDHASASNLSHTAFLERLLAVEVTATTARRQASLARFACLPAPWQLSDFDFDAQPSVDRKLVNELGTPAVPRRRHQRAADRPARRRQDHARRRPGPRRRHRRLPHLLHHRRRPGRPLPQAAIEGRWATTMRFFAGPRLLIIDELGYLPMQAEGAAALFQVITQRYFKGSIVLTTNLGIPSWGKIFDDPMVAAAMLDRLLHRSVVLNITGESYRMRAHRARAGKLRAGDGAP